LLKVHKKQDAPSQPTSFLKRLRPSSAQIALGLLVLLTYMPTLGNGFIWDDALEHVGDNPLLRSGAGLWHIWFDPVGHYFPLSYTLLSVEYHFWGDHPFWYHAVSVLLHMANTLLLLHLLNRVRVPAATIIAAMFAVHPVQVATVAWVIEQKNLLAFFFYQLSLLAWLRFRATDNVLHFTAVLLSFLAAMASKTIAISLPLVLLLYEWAGTGTVSRTRAVAAFCLMIAAVPLALISTKVHAQLLSDYALGPLDRLLVVSHSWWFYLGQVLWPAEHLGVYPQWVIDPREAWQWMYPASAVALILMLWQQRERLGRWPFASVTFFTLSLGPILGFVDYSVMEYAWVHDHHLYFACLGLLVPIGLLMRLAGRWLAPHLRMPAAPALVAGAVILLMAYTTFQRTFLFRDVETYFQHNVQRNPSAWPAHLGLAGVYEARMERERARHHLEEARRIKPHPQVLNNFALFELAEWRGKRALSLLDEALLQRPGDIQLLSSRERVWSSAPILAAHSSWLIACRKLVW
jgi:hypothetical protein